MDWPLVASIIAVCLIPVGYWFGVKQERMDAVARFVQCANEALADGRLQSYEVTKLLEIGGEIFGIKNAQPKNKE